MTHKDAELLGASLRFIPGGVFGAILGFWLAVQVNTPVLFFGTIVACSVVGGLLSTRFGLRFWETLRHLRWFPF